MADHISSSTTNDAGRPARRAPIPPLTAQRRIVSDGNLPGSEQSPRRPPSASAAGPNVLASSSPPLHDHHNHNGDGHEPMFGSGDGLPSYKKEKKFNWRKVKKKDKGGTVSCLEVFSEEPEEAVKVRRKERRVKSDVFSDDEISRNPYIDEFSAEFKKANPTPTLVRRSIARVVEDWAGDDVPTLEAEDTRPRLTQSAKATFAVGSPGGGGGSGGGERKKEKEKERKRQYKEAKQDRSKLFELHTKTSERLESVEKAVAHLGQLLELHHEKQSVELSRFVMVITNELAANNKKKDRDDVGRYAARIDALERSLQETKVNMMEALVLNAKKVELLAKKDKEIEELQLKLKRKNDEIEILRRKAKALPPLPNEKGGDRTALVQSLPRVGSPPPLPLLSIDTNMPRDPDPASPVSPTSPARRRSASYKSTTSVAVKPGLPTVTQLILHHDIEIARAARLARKRSSLILDRPHLAGEENQEDAPYDYQEGADADGEEGADAEEDDLPELDDDDGQPRRDGTGPRLKAKGNKAMRTLGIDPSQEKLINALGLEVPPTMLANSTLPQLPLSPLDDDDPKTPKTPNKLLNFIIAGGKRK